MRGRPLNVYLGALLLTAVAAGAHAAPVTLYYPTERSADFSVAVPGDWDLEEAEEEGGFFTVTGPTGAQLSFRTIETVDAAIALSGSGCYSAGTIPKPCTVRELRVKLALNIVLFDTTPV